jgi:cytochrome P450
MEQTGKAGSESAMDIDEFYRHHFDYTKPGEPEMREHAIDQLASQCPVTHSDALGGFLLINKYELVADVFRDWETFSNLPGKYIHARAPGRFLRAPVDTDPPVQRSYRQIMLPFLRPAVLEKCDPGIRELSSGIIDEFIEDGRCELVSQFAHPFPGQMFYRFILGLEDNEVSMLQEWQRVTVYRPKSPDAAIAMERWVAWIRGFVVRRRSEPRQDDIVDALLYATVDGVNLTDDAVGGAIMGLIEGGFSTQRDAISSIMLRLAERPDLQQRLRQNQNEIPAALDEFLRFDPPVPGRERLCTKETSLEDEVLHPSDRVFINLMAAHRDRDEFANPNEIDIDRSPNRHFAFGLGAHRCIGSNIARLNLNIVISELLGRLGKFHLTEGEMVRREAFAGWGPTSLPLSFVPGTRRAKV